MTALTEYQKLESTGLWRADPSAQRRDVIVSLGEATLIITDGTDRALAHWSLPALERRRGGVPALYSPGADATEELEIDDPAMIDAIDRVQRAILRRRPRPGQLRTALLGAAFVAVLALAVLWLPGALVRHAVSIVPPATRIAIGADLLDRLERTTGPICISPRGTQALRQLGERLRGTGRGPVLVVPAGIAATTSLPGGTILVNRALVEDFETPEVAAGYILAEDQRAREHDPLLSVLREAGPVASFKLLTTGKLPPGVMDAYAEWLPTHEPAPVSEDALISRFAKARVSTEPYGYARDVTGEESLPLIEADPMAAEHRAPLLSDGDWVALQEICGG